MSHPDQRPSCPACGLHEPCKACGKPPLALVAADATFDVVDEVTRLREQLARLTAPIDGLSPGPVYTLADVDRIEAARGKPYERLRATVEALEDARRTIAKALGGGR